MKVNPVREKILEFLRKKKGDIEGISFRDMGVKIGLGSKYEVNPQIVAHNLKYLEEKGFIRRDDPSKRKYTVLKEPVNDVVYIKLYNITAQCGPEGFLGEDDIKEEVPLPSKTFGITNPDDYFLIRAKGDSMEPMIHNGDLVLARLEPNVENGQIRILVDDEEVKIKKVFKHSKGYSLVSLNDKYPVKESGKTDVRIVGKIQNVISGGGRGFLH